VIKGNAIVLHVVVPCRAKPVYASVSAGFPDTPCSLAMPAPPSSGTGGGYISLIQRSMTAPRGLTPSTPSRGSTPSWRNSTPPATAGGLGFGLGGECSAVHEDWT
jgi:hypothetical protein